MSSADLSKSETDLLLVQQVNPPSQIPVFSPWRKISPILRLGHRRMKIRDYTSL